MTQLHHQQYTSTTTRLLSTTNTTTTNDHHHQQQQHHHHHHHLLKHSSSPSISSPLAACSSYPPSSPSCRSRSEEASHHLPSSPSSHQSIQLSSSDLPEDSSELDLPSIPASSMDDDDHDDSMMLVQDEPDHEHLLVPEDRVRTADRHHLPMFPSSFSSSSSSSSSPSSPPKIGIFHHSFGSSSPGPSWLPELAPNRHHHQLPDRLTSFPSRPGALRSRQFKQPPHLPPFSAKTTPSSTSSSSGCPSSLSPTSRRVPSRGGNTSTPFSSPTPLSRDHHPSRRLGESPSPSELRQRAATRARRLERQMRSNNHRSLLDTFSIGNPRGLDDPSLLLNHDLDEQRALDIIGQRHLRLLHRQWDALLSSQAYGTDELIELAQQSQPQHEDDRMDEDEGERYEYEEEEEDWMTLGEGGGEMSMRSTNSTIRPDADGVDELISILLDPKATCPVCTSSTPSTITTNRNTLSSIRNSTLNDHDPQQEGGDGVECSSCHWYLDRHQIEIVDRHFYQHGDRRLHRPLVAYNPHFGLHFTCSNSECDELVCL